LGHTPEVLTPRPTQAEVANQRLQGQRRAEDLLGLADQYEKSGRYGDALYYARLAQEADPASGKTVARVRRLLERQAEADREARGLQRDGRQMEMDAMRAGLSDTPLPVPGAWRPDGQDWVDLHFPPADPLLAREEADILSRPLTFNYAEAPLQLVLQDLFSLCGLGAMYDTSIVDGQTVTLRVNGHRAEDVLDYLCLKNGLAYRQKGRVITLYPGDSEEARLFNETVVIPIRYPPIPRGTMLDIGAQGPSDPGVNPDVEGDGGADNHILTLMKRLEETDPEWPPETQYWYDMNHNRLVVTSTPRMIRKVRRMVALFDQPAVQVQVVVRFVTLDTSALHAFGIDWSLSTVDAQNGGAGEWWNSSRRGPHLLGGTAPFGQADPDASARLAGVIRNHTVDATITAIQNSGKGHMVQAPLLSAFNGQATTLSLTYNQPYINDLDPVSVGYTADRVGMSASVAWRPVYSEQEVGTELTVLPYVAADMRTVTLDIHPRVTMQISEYPYTLVSQINDTVQEKEIMRPIFRTNELRVRASVEDGGTLVLGGLMTEEMTERVRKVPGLARVPLLGALFRNKRSNETGSMLLIFVTPYIVTAGNQRYVDAPGERGWGSPAAGVPPRDRGAWLGGVLGDRPPPPADPPARRRR